MDGAGAMRRMVSCSVCKRAVYYNGERDGVLRDIGGHEVGRMVEKTVTCKPCLPGGTRRGGP